MNVTVISSSQVTYVMIYHFLTINGRKMFLAPSWLCVVYSAMSCLCLSVDSELRLGPVSCLAQVMSLTAGFWLVSSPPSSLLIGWHPVCSCRHSRLGHSLHWTLMSDLATGGLWCRHGMKSHDFHHYIVLFTMTNAGYELRNIAPCSRVILVFHHAMVLYHL